MMNVQERFNLIKQVGEEIITEEDLMKLLSEKKNPIAYDGFEPSGIIHVAQGIMRAININKMTKAGCKFKMFVADWHAWANNKLGGDLEKIQNCGNYLIEVWRASGMDMDNVEFVWANDLIHKDEYLKLMMQIARHATVKRILRCSQIMGRSESDALQASQIFYPVMQCADIFQLKADICQLGMDQRKVNMLARELGPKLGLWSPVAVHHHMLMGLSQPPASKDTDAVERAIAMKMSKSNPDSAIFMDDSAEDIKRKINKAYCPEKQLFENPIIEYNKYMLFELFKKIEIKRPEKFGGNVEYNSFEHLAKDFEAGKLHPMDLKAATAEYLNKALDDFRKKFNKNSKAKKLYEQVKSYQITR